MKWVSSLQVSDLFEDAMSGALKSLKSQLGRSKASVAFIFISTQFRQEVIDLWGTIYPQIPAHTIIGCTGGGIIGGQHEVEDRPAVSIVAAILPKVEVQSFDISQDQLPNPDSGPASWHKMANTSPNKNPQFILLSDPFTIDIDALLSGLDFSFPKSIKVGGLASGGIGPNEHLLINNRKLLTSGAVGVSLSGPITVESVVAQGCRPIGEPMAVTQVEGNVLLGLNRKPPLKYLSELYDTLNTRDRDLLSTSLFLGAQTNPFLTHPKQGDFLIRTILGLDQDRGGLAVGAFLRVGQIVQFHLRDANTSREDLQLMLSRVAKNNSPSSGAVLFSCLGRGKGLYGKPHHDIQLVKSMIGDIPVGGFFCNGEIGPVSGTTYLHGYTSSMAVFHPAAV